MATYTLNYTDEQFKELHGLLVELGTIFRNVCEEEGIWYSLAFGTMLGAVRESRIIPWDSDMDVYIKFEDLEKLRSAFARRQFADIKYINRDVEEKFLSSHDVLMSFKSKKYEDVHVDIYPIVGAPATKKEQDHIAYIWNYQDRIIRSKYVDIRRSHKKFLVAIAKIIDAFIPDKVLNNNIRKRERKYNMYETGFWMTLVNYGPGRSCFPISYLDGCDIKQMNGEDFKVMKGWDGYLKTVYGDYMTPKKY